MHDAIVHFAAESHADRSILSPEPVVRTNLNGTFVLLEAARRFHVSRFVHVSTDEVYGSLEAPREATEDFPLNPSSPYSAAKSGSDLLARSYYVTFKLPVLITRASNNYGPYQFPEKLIPLMIANALEDNRCLFMATACRCETGCTWRIIAGESWRCSSEGEIYNIGGSRSPPNLEVVRRVLQFTGKPQTLIHYVTDRPGHDHRYALSNEKIMRETPWRPQIDFETGLVRTIERYCANAA